MAVIHGIEGEVSVTGGYAVKAHSWTIEFEAVTSDVTGFSDYVAAGPYRERLSGLLSWTGSYSCRWDSSASILGKLGGAEAAAVFSFDQSGTANGSIGGNIIITGISANVDVEDANSVTFTFEGNGGVTYTAPS